MNYRHSYHAGNFADLIKHLVLVETLLYLQKKESSLLVIDLHGGAGRYLLSDASTSEAVYGFLKLRACKNIPDLFVNYLRLQNTTAYAGSPALIAALLREQDRGIIFETVPEVFTTLQEALNECKPDRKLEVRHQDGYQELKACLPPKHEKRALIVIDPPYEHSEDYRKVQETVLAIQKKFPTAAVIVWYPITKNTHLIEELQKQLLDSQKKITIIETHLNVFFPQERMNRCGLLLINPVFGLAQRLEENDHFFRDNLDLTVTIRGHH